MPSTFSGTATLTTTNSRASGPFTEPLTLTLLFSNDLSQLSLASFPAITGPAPGQPPISTPLGNDTFTITLEPGVPGNGTGTFDPAAGNLTLTLALHLHNSVHIVTPGDEDSNISFTGTQSLTTGTCTSADGKISLTGSAYNAATGAITMAGATKISGGFLGGSDCGLTVTGALSLPTDVGDFLEFYKQPNPAPWQVFNHSTGVGGATVSATPSIYAETDGTVHLRP
jgi:hypothetical protein